MSKDNLNRIKVVALAGGVGGARMADGLAQIIPAANLSVIVNVGDDFEHLGLKISPDLDTVCYTLAGLENPEMGWGRVGETFTAMENLKQLDGPDWFRLGDKDLATHLYRTHRINEGASLTEVTEELCRNWGVEQKVLPVTDYHVPTIVHTEFGDLAFQEYFVQQQCSPSVTGFKFQGAGAAKAGPDVFRSLEEADLVIICPSNPWVSIDPILMIPGVRQLIRQKTTVAVSPIIGGKTVKGPAAKMYAELGIEPSSLAVAIHYREIINGIVIDDVDVGLQPQINELGMDVLATDSIMKDKADRARLANEVMSFALKMLQLEKQEK